MDDRNLKRYFCFNVVFNRLHKKWPVILYQRRLNGLLMAKRFPDHATGIGRKLSRWQRGVQPDDLMEDMKVMTEAGLLVCNNGIYSITPLGLTCLSDYDHALRIVRIDR
jgi:predicted transcriptional regulator